MKEGEMTTAIGNSTIDIERLKREYNTLHIFTSRLRFEKVSTNKYRSHCPFHADSTASFDVYQYQGVWLYKCLGCGVAGNVFQFLMRLDGVTFPEALKETEEYVGGSPQKSLQKYIIPVIPEIPKLYRTYSLDDTAVRVKIELRL
jgi:DNA primase